MKKTITLLTILMLVVFMIGCENSINPIEPQTQNDNESRSLAKNSASSLTCKIDYAFYDGPAVFDVEGRILIWVGNIHEGIEGQILWYFVTEGAGPPNMPLTAHVSFYEAGWEIWVGEDLLLAGESSGKTASPKDKDGFWRGNGIVKEAFAEYGDWIGRHTNESGNVNWVFPYSGVGIFKIN